LQDVLEGLEEMQARISDILDSRAHEWMRWQKSAQQKVWPP
jgi:hypothetical protein